MPRFCASCGSQMDESATFCASCGAAVGQPGGPTGTVPAPAVVPTPVASTSGLEDNIAAALAYFVIPAIIFLFLEPYNKRSFVRFHSFQCIILFIVELAISFALGLIAEIPILGLVVLVAGPLFGLACLVLWVVLVIKAYQNQKFKLPVIGDMAEKQAGA